MTSHSGTQTPSRIIIAAPWSWAGVVQWIGMAMDRQAQRARLASLDPRLLRDIGLTRAQALAEARRPWWQG
ncbi:DUF1127 domain-containing protein [Roseomonas sp. CAU 1739]|uniref:DUF1127 domain-containing protein n=1 Tax=Roseomonas sp. CAU 1739 TaxID=3140364 RepID=UPI00325AECFB